MFDANRRVENYRKSVAFVDENVLMFKGFLGPSLKDKPELVTVGARAARAAGVIVDSLGKLRCPPGTPNANQFTDMQMSNCMVPGMGTAKKLKDRAANAMGTLLSTAGKAMDKKGVKGAMRVAAMASLASLDVLDYKQNDGSGAMSATILAMGDIVRSAGREVAERALDRLQRNGKISQEQREQLDKVVDKLAPIAAERLVLGGVQAVNAWRRARKQRTPTTETADALEPRQPKLKQPRHLIEPNAMGSVDVSQVLPSAPEKSMRTENNMPITVDAERFNGELAQKVSSLLDKYGIDKSLPPSQQLDGLAKKMGVVLPRSMSKQLDDSVEYLLGEGKTVADGFVQGINNPDPLAVDVLRVKGQSILDAVKLAESGPEGRAQVREAIAQGYLETITGVEMMFTDNPAMRGALMLDLHGDEYSKKFPAMKEAAGYAYQTYTPNGMMTQVNFLPHSLMFDQDAIQGIVPKGQGLNHSVRFSGADDHQIGLGIHEAAHAEHFYHQYAALGIKIGQDSGTIEQQVRAKGPRLEDSYIGVMFAHRYEFSSEMTWDEVVEQLDKAGSNESLDSLMAVVAQDATRINMKTGTPADDAKTGYLYSHFGGANGIQSGKQTVSVIEAVENYTRAQQFPNIVPFLPRDEQGNQIPIQRLTQAQTDEVYEKAKAAVKLELPENIELVDPNTGEVLSDEGAAKMVKDAMNGQFISGLAQEYVGVRNDYLGIRESTISTNGVPNEEVMAALGVSSDYGKTNIMEATAEGRVVDVYGRNFTSFNMEQEQVTKVREMLGRLFPKSYDDRPSGKPPSAAVLQQKIQQITSRMPTIRRKEGSVDSVV
jgi:hypothetical protein